MAEPSYDRSGAARQALQEIYRDYGLAGLDNDALLKQILPDLLAGSPRESSIVQAAAAADVGSLLQTRVQGGMTPDAAVRDVAAVLTERSALDPNACLWVASEYAAALGHPVNGPLTPMSAPPMTPPTPGMPGVSGAPPVLGMPTAPATAAMPGMPGGPGMSGPVSPPVLGTPPMAGGDRTAMDPGMGGFPPGGAAATPAYPYSPAPAPMPAPMPMPYSPYGTQPPKKSSAGMIFGIIAGAVALICVIGVVGYFALKPDDKCTGSDCKKVTSTSHSPSVGISSKSPVPQPPEPTELIALLPGDIDATSDCLQHGTATPDGFTGLADQYDCLEGSGSQIEGALIDAYLFDDLSSLHASYTELNKDYDFTPRKSGDSCPPSGGDSNGYTTWHHTSEPDTVIGTVECYSTNDGGHVYIWSNEPNLTLYVTKTDKSTSFATLNKWWAGSGCCGS